MKKLIFLTALTLMVSLAYAVVAPFFEVRAVVANPHFAPAALPQGQTRSPIRTLPGLEEIRVWLGPTRVDFSFGPNHTALTERRAALDFSSFDMRPPAPEGRVQVYDVFYSNADGTLNADGAYLTIEAVSNNQTAGLGGGNVAEVGLRSFGSTTFEYGNVIASFVALGSNADPTSNSNAIDGNTQTYTTLGNTADQSQRLRITISFPSSVNGCPDCIIVIFSTVGAVIFSPIFVVSAARDRNCLGIPDVLLDVEVTNNSGEGDFRRTVISGEGFHYSRGKVSRDLITVTGTTKEGERFQCVQQVEWRLNTQCPLENSLQGMPNTSATLTGAREFRDDVLAKSPRGKVYTDLYYKSSSEAVRIMMFNPMLMLRSRELIERYKPVIQSIVNGEQVALTCGDLDEIDGFLNSFAAKGSSQLKQAINGVCKDLRDPQVHAEFGITMIEGPKREMPALPHIIGRAGGVSGFLGLCVVSLVFLFRRRDRTSRANARPCSCLPQLGKTRR